MGGEQGFGQPRLFVEVFHVAGRHETVQIDESLLILRVNDDVVGPFGFDHLLQIDQAVERRRGVHLFFLSQGHQAHKNLRGAHRVVDRPMVVAHVDFEITGQFLEVVPRNRRNERPGHRQRIDVSNPIGNLIFGHGEA